MKHYLQSVASPCAGYDCPVYPVLLNNNAWFLISGEISFAYELQRDVMLKDKKNKTVVEANVVILFSSYARFFGCTPYVVRRKNLHNIVNKRVQFAYIKLVTLTSRSVCPYFQGHLV